MSLDHVCLRTLEHGMLPISAEQAVKEYPEVDRSVHGKRYFCMLCHQFVTLAKGEKQQPAFRHSRGAKNKDCPDRTDSTPEYKAFEQGIHVPRIRMDWESDHLPKFSICLSRHLLEAALRRGRHDRAVDDFTVTVAVNGMEARRFSEERFRTDGMTELSVGTEPPQKLIIRCFSNDQEVLLPWKSEKELFSSEGALFEKTTGTFQRIDAEVRLDWDYMLLTKKRTLPRMTGLKTQRLRTYNLLSGRWYVHSFRLTAEGKHIPEVLSEYLLAFPYFLTDAPLRLRPLWPVMTRDGEELHIAQQQPVTSVDFALRAWGRESVQVFSFEGANHRNSALHFSGNSGLQKASLGYARAKIYQRNGLLTVLLGRVHALDAIYIVAESTFGAQETAPPSFSVTTTAHGSAPACSGEVHEVPEQLYFSADYDAEIHVFEDGLLVQKQALREGDAPFRVKPSMGQRVELVIGCDCVFSVTYTRAEQKEAAYNLLPAWQEKWKEMRMSRLVLIDRPLIEAAKRLLRVSEHDPSFARWWKQSLRLGMVPEAVRQMILKRSEAIRYGTGMERNRRGL